MVLLILAFPEFLETCSLPSVKAYLFDRNGVEEEIVYLMCVEDWATGVVAALFYLVRIDNY